MSNAKIEYIKKLQREFEKSLNQLDKLYEMGIANSDTFIDVVSRSEKLTEAVRNLGGIYFRPDTKELSEKIDINICEHYPIDIEYQGKDNFELTLPNIVSKKGGNKKYINHTLQVAIKRKIEEYDIGKRINRVVVIKYILYDDGKNQISFPDYENIEISAILNALVDTVLIDDSPKYYHLFQTRSFVDKPEETAVKIGVFSEEYFSNILLSKKGCS